MEANELENAIVAFVSRPHYKPIKPRVIAQRLGVSKDEVQAVKKAIKRLVQQGRIAYGSNHLVQKIGARSDAPRSPDASRSDASRPDANRIVGFFRRAEGGYGFVRPSATAADGPASPDIFIPADRTGDAAPGDIVAVRLKGRKDRHPGPRGEIIEVVERQSQRFVGTYFESDGMGCVQVDGSAFGDPIALCDPGARGVVAGDKVVVEMLRFPTASRRGEGVIVEVLGPLGKPGVDTLSVIREFNLPEEFPADVLEEARCQTTLFTEEIPEGRFDATGETIVTIDPVDARDFDDAISLVQIERGHWRLGVHIADVSHFVRPRTALDREARSRATSVYLPDRVIPMLPELISNGLASLQPDKIRYTKTVYIEFTPEGEPVEAKFHSAAIRSSKRLTYEQVDEFLANPAKLRSRWGAGVCDLLGRMRDLARVLRRRRMDRGSLEMNMPEVKIELDKQGCVTGARVVENTESHQIVEEFMLAANVAVAEMLAERGLAFLRRVHRDPTLVKLQALADFVAELGFPADDLMSRFALQKLLDTVAGKPQQHAVHYAVLRSLQRAVYSPKDEGHFALAFDCYCHFTSPIRRYPDLTVHRLLQAIWEGKPPRQDADELLGLGEHCSNQEQRAEKAERQLTRLKLLQYFSTRIGEEMDAVITGVESYGLFVEGTPLPAEGLVHIDSLVDDYYRYDRATHTLSGGRSDNAYRLGDVVRVAVARVDLERRELDFRLVDHGQRSPAPGRRGRDRVKPPRGRGHGRTEAQRPPADDAAPGEQPPAKPSGKSRRATGGSAGGSAPGGSAGAGGTGGRSGGATGGSAPGGSAGGGTPGGVAGAGGTGGSAAARGKSRGKRPPPSAKPGGPPPPSGHARKKPPKKVRPKKRRR